MTKKDEYGLVAIPSKFDFWLVMMNNQIYVINSRRTIEQKVIEHLDLNSIEHSWTDELNITRSGIEETAEFNNKFCMKIKLMNPN